MVDPHPKAADGDIVAAEPQLSVRDLDAACRFYVDRLGFALAFTYGEPPFYAQVRRGGARLNLRVVHGAVFDSSFRAREGGALAATLVLDEAEPLYRAYEAAGVAFHQPLKTESWGARTFVVSDPDGNLIAFAGS